MYQIFIIAAGSLIRYVQLKLSELDIWNGPYGQVKEVLKTSHSICERWVQACDMLTVQFWKRYGPHPWKGPKFVPENLAQLAKRLEEVTDVYFMFTTWF